MGWPRCPSVSANVEVVSREDPPRDATTQLHAHVAMFSGILDIASSRMSSTSVIKHA
jgi:hypothetical protein